jgi:MFS family permease
VQILKNHISFPLFLLFSSQLIRLTAVAVVTPVFSIYMVDLGFAISDLGIASATLGVALIIFEPIWGFLVNRWGARRIFLLSALLTTLILLSYAFVRDLTGFVFVRFLSGIFGSAGAVSTRTLVWQAVPRKERAFGIWYTIFAAGGVVGPVIGGLVATQGYVSVFYVASVIAAVAFFLSLSIPTIEQQDTASSGTNPIQNMDKSERKVLFMTSFLVVVPLFLRTVYLIFVPVFAKESSKLLLGPIEIGMVVAAMGVAGFFAPFIHSELVSKAGVKEVTLIGMLLEFGSFMLLPSVNGFPFLCLTAILLGSGEAAISISMMTFLMDKMRLSNRGLAIGVFGAGEDVGILVGPLIVGYLYRDYGAEFSFYLTAMLMLVNVILSISLLRRISR